ncbi:MAG: hypothetical protein HC933_05130 [Pleurocapsa sp. SU_196_0]|nr:hypothetical protein [Pleurocapsa sp. SU_196_0]
MYNVQSDARRFLETGDSSLWRGAYLAGIQGIEGYLLETVTAALYLQLEQCAKSLLGVEPAQSARLAQILLSMKPFDQAALALVLRALQKQKDYVGISRLYKRAIQSWLEVGEPLPQRWTDFLNSIKAA